ncbi:aspartic peptidase domain-containing protein [Cadophora sp. MPI-SDFR-AT-0126]|nr:aspartic peptidase domain-containing protein [Leotiomycetes sp. MPI-SDFR-AT-0126]
MHTSFTALLTLTLFAHLTTSFPSTAEKDIGTAAEQLQLNSEPRSLLPPSPDVKVSTWVAISRGVDGGGEMRRRNGKRSGGRGDGGVGMSKVGREMMRRHFGVEWIHSVQLGQAWHTPLQINGKTYKLMIDTGSSDTWIVSKDFNCIGEGGITLSQADCDFGPKYSPGREFEPVRDVNFNIVYGDGSYLRGSYGVLGVELAGIWVKTQIALAKDVGWVAEGITSGLLGLSYPSITFAFSGTNYSADTPEKQVPYDPIFTSMWKQHKISHVFSLAIGRPSVPPSSAPEGYLALGGLAPVSTTGPWARADIEISPLGPGYTNRSLPYPQIQWYTITPDAFLYTTTPAGQPPVWKPLNTGPPGTPKFQTLIDSGVTHTWLPTPIADHVASLFVPPAVWNQTVYGYSVPCTAQVPQLAVKINGVILPWHKKDIIMDDFTGEGGCVSGVNNGRGYAPYTLGDTWMRSNLVVFDVGRGEVRVRSRGEY